MRSPLREDRAPVAPGVRLLNELPETPFRELRLHVVAHRTAHVEQRVDERARVVERTERGLDDRPDPGPRRRVAPALGRRVIGKD